MMAMAAATSSVRPRFSTVSIIPGIEIAAPDRTESNSGADASPSRAPAQRKNYVSMTLKKEEKVKAA